MIARDLPYKAARRERELDVAYESFTSAVASLLGRTVLEVLRAVVTRTDVRAKLESFVGPSDLSLFQSSTTAAC
jgi:hypothetical protein